MSYRGWRGGKSGERGRLEKMEGVMIHKKPSIDWYSIGTAVNHGLRSSPSNFSAVTCSGGLTPFLLGLSNHLLSWHFIELGDDTTPQRSTDEQSLFKATGHPIKENPDKVTGTCTYGMKPRPISKHGVSVPLWGLQKSNMKLQSYFDIGDHTRIVISVTCGSFDVSSFYFFPPSFLIVMSMGEIFHQRCSKCPPGAR